MTTLTVRPAGAGAHTDWTPSTGSNWQCVDEASPDDSDFVSSTSFGAIDLYTQSGGVPAGATVNSITVHVRAKASLASFSSIEPYIRSGTTESGPSSQLLSDAFADYNWLFSTDPATGSAWTVSAANACQIGVNAQNSFGFVTETVSQVYADIDYTAADVSVTPAAATITVQTFTPTVVANLTVTPSAKTLTLATFTPTVSEPVLATPTFVAVPVQRFTPVVTASASGVVTPGPAIITVQGFTPGVSTPRLTTPLALALTLALFTPLVQVTAFNLSTLIGKKTPRLYASGSSTIRRYR